MNITALDIYLFGLLDKVDAVAFVAGLVGLITGLAWMFSVTEDFMDEYRPRLKAACLSCCAVLILVFLIPSQGTFAAMVLLPRIQESEIIKRDFPMLYQAARDHLLNAVQPKKDTKHD